MVWEIGERLRAVLVEDPKLPPDLTHLLGRLQELEGLRGSGEDQGEVRIARESPRGKFQVLRRADSGRHWSVRIREGSGLFVERLAFP
jgi:hypothetical protein